MMDELFEAWLKERVKQVALRGDRCPPCPPMPAGIRGLERSMSVAPPRQLLRGASSPSTCWPERLGALLDPLLEPCRFQLGQTVLDPKVMPKGVLLVRSGQLRSLAPAPRGKGLRTIERLGPGSAIGWVGLVRQRPCERLRATTEVEALLLPAQPFQGAAGGPSLHRGGVPAPAGGC